MPRAFGPGLPAIRDWTERHYCFAGYIPGFDPGALPDRSALRAQLGYGEEPVCVVSVGGSGVGAPLLHRVVEALAPAREHVPGLRMVGPRIDPARLPRVEGLEVRGYVHELYRHLAACDVGVVQGGLTTTMELVATGRPCVALPLASHFEQRFHVRHRLDRYGARAWLDYDDVDAPALARAIADGVASTPSYRRVEGAGAGRAAPPHPPLARRAVAGGPLATGCGWERQAGRGGRSCPGRRARRRRRRPAHHARRGLLAAA